MKTLATIFTFLLLSGGAHAAQNVICAGDFTKVEISLSDFAAQVKVAGMTFDDCTRNLNGSSLSIHCGNNVRNDYKFVGLDLNIIGSKIANGTVAYSKDGTIYGDDSTEEGETIKLQCQ